MTWTVTAKGWCLLCPVWIAGANTPDVVPIPRHRWLGFWLEFNFWLQDIMITMCEQLNPTETFCYQLHHVTDVDPFQITT